LILFRKSLIKKLKQWRVAGDRIGLGNLGKAFADRNELDLNEAILHHTGASPGAIFF
jgi:hypothetical protein